MIAQQWEKDSILVVVFPLLKRPRAANQTSDCSARIHQGHEVMGAPRARGNPMMRVP